MMHIVLFLFFLKNKKGVNKMVIKAPCKHCIPDEMCLKCGDCERYKVYRKGVLKEKERDKQNEKENY